MLKRARRYLDSLSKVALGKRIAGRALTVFPNDIFLVSYLRSGSTWARFLVGNFLYQDKTVSFTNLNQLIPVIDGHPDHRLRRLPRVLKSHECFDPRYPRVVYFVRDPRDVAVSFYFYNLKVRELPEGYPLDDFVDRRQISRQPFRRGIHCLSRGSRLSDFHRGRRASSSMARITRHLTLSIETAAIDRRDHPHHRACRPLGFLVVFVEVTLDVAELATDTQ